MAFSIGQAPIGKSRWAGISGFSSTKYLDSYILIKLNPLPAVVNLFPRGSFVKDGENSHC
ncbi:hypothetical protein Ptr902_10389 [Pyrenophora tritici-repentis]|uniref:Uncharacterized protein n=1 Tax=Pyrenophora tritici-repentis TaxID=45151 RepID=A0A5M9KXX4_9PLEO|nr:hypothetical protein PtrV1_10794 [Pyrenophora tritici-repentis]KAF7566237.1 hypothetical protein PtrM4_145570 [Pyrenophora tritici-repentis]KAI0576681.1 hypothetical protein Alg215_07360 [Pyrenophora tritici-repentis]KAI0580502.1 hypothetical protein Alg130_07040 [Pyrenophora tritici-repentis]KAI0608265.1 hypothetical protein TUN205_07478 [Pyrenophora tritici-repentis]